MKSIAIHGLGYVGLTAAVHWARAGWFVVGYDPDHNTIARLRAGNPRAGEFLSYLDEDVKELVTDGSSFPWFDRHGNDILGTGGIYPTSNPEDAYKCPVQLLAVPTERDGEPYDDIALRVIEMLLCRLVMSTATRDIIVESTLTPGTIDRVLASCFPDGQFPEDKTLAVCPRRDWFASRDTHLGVMKRIVGGVNERSTARAVELLLSVSTDIEATDYRTAEITKVLENALLHTAISLPTELAINLPQHNIAEALRLATTHPRLMRLFIGAGQGGRCVPLGPKYLQKLNGPHELLATSLTIDRSMREACAQAVLERLQEPREQRVLVLGAAYRPDFKDAGLSPGLAIAKLLHDAGVRVQVHDPMWTDTEMLDLVAQYGMVGCGHGDALPLSLDYDAIVLATPHTAYRDLWLDPGALTVGARLCFILDAQGTWRDDTPVIEGMFGIEYKQIGTPGWLK
jgi:nucleotide sugar dehydrogenase